MCSIGGALALNIFWKLKLLSFPLTLQNAYLDINANYQTFNIVIQITRIILTTIKPNFNKPKLFM